MKKFPTVLHVAKMAQHVNNVLILIESSMKNKTHVYVNNLCIKTNKNNVNIATIIEIVNNAYKKIIVQFVT